ncbi:MAG: PRC-barrel domain-containing protein, partial [Methyloceanibacter sp.]
MTRLLTSTAVALVLGLTPALAQAPADQAQTPPALQDPAQPSEAVPSEPAKPAAPLAGETSEPDAIPGQSSEMM